MALSLLIIDPFVKQPVNNCFNRLAQTLPAKLYLWQPAFLPLTSFTLPKVQGYVVLGSATHVFEKLLWQDQLREFLLEKLQQKKPVLGLCYGHQLLAHAFGAKVAFAFTDERKILGMRSITWGKQSYHLGVTHRQIVTQISPELKSLSHHPDLGHDLISHSKLPFLGCQAHPEASDQFLHADCQLSSKEWRKSIDLESKKFLRRWIKTYF